MCLGCVQKQTWTPAAHAEYDDGGTPDLSTVKPMVDGGTEGLKGHARVIIPGVTPCFECTLWLFPPQTRFPLCTLAETPRRAVPSPSSSWHATQRPTAEPARCAADQLHLGAANVPRSLFNQLASQGAKC